MHDPHASGKALYCTQLQWCVSVSVFVVRVVHVPFMCVDACAHRLTPSSCRGAWVSLAVWQQHQTDRGSRCQTLPGSRQQLVGRLVVYVWTAVMGHGGATAPVYISTSSSLAAILPGAGGWLASLFEDCCVPTHYAVPHLHPPLCL